MKPLKGPVAVLLFVGMLILIGTPVYAWSCSEYNFRVTASGEVQVENRSNSDEPAQKADIFVNGEKVINDAKVPAKPAHSDWESFAETSPPAGDWTWKVRGESDCSDSGSHYGPTAVPSPTTAARTDTPAPTATDTETAVPPTPVPSATATLQPTETNSLPTDVPPTDEPQPTDTPRPHKTAVPTATRTSAPAATATAIPTFTPSPGPEELNGCTSCGCCCVCTVQNSSWSEVQIELDEDAVTAIAQIASEHQLELQPIQKSLDNIALAILAAGVSIGIGLVAVAIAGDGKRH